MELMGGYKGRIISAPQRITPGPASPEEGVSPLLVVGDSVWGLISRATGVAGKKPDIWPC